MAENKTRPTGASVKAYIDSVQPDVRRDDARLLLEMMQRITGWSPRMWGPSIIGYGRYDYTYKSGHSGSAMVTGFAPRKANQVLYIMPGYANAGEQLARLGKHKLGRSCLYVTRLANVDMAVLEELVRDGVTKMGEMYTLHPE